MKYSIEIIKEIIRRNNDIGFCYFWGHTPNYDKIGKQCLSQWYDCWFEIDGVQYHTTEQYMMASKARLFGDDEVLQEIMLATSPLFYKKLGREVRGFEQVRWNEVKYDVVVNGNKAKFSQNPLLKEFLLSTGDVILAEASPYDRIWGIGLDAEHAKQGGVELWKGENLLGCALMETRDWLRNGE